MPSRPAVLWDLDCTIVDSFELLFQAYRHAVRAVLGWELTRERLRQELGPPLPLHMEQYSVEQAEPLVKAYQGFYNEHHDDYARLFDGVREALEAGERRGWRQAVVTSRGGNNTHRRLGAWGLLPHFGAIVTAQDTDRAKPDAAPVRVALERLGARPEEAFLVGDDVVDIQAARAAGVRSIAALWGARDVGRLLGERPDYRAERPADVLQLIPAVRP